MATFSDNCNNGPHIQGLIVMSCPQNTSNNYSFIQKILRKLNQTSNECQKYEPKSLNFGTDSNVDSNVDSFDIKIDNKYYSANIFLFDIKDKQLLNKRFNDSVNGVIIYNDFNEDSSFVDLQSWLPFINRFDNEIKLLICQTIDDKCLTERHVIEKWCLDNEFELIELCPQTDPNQENDFENVDGMIRVLEAIQAYHWPNSTLKEQPKYNPSPHFKNLIEDEVSNNISNVSNEVNDKNIDLSNQLEDIQQIDDNLDHFNDLFEKFSQMKVKSSQMNETNRKLYAERVTIAFWKAMGGDINEIDGLEDEDI